MMIMVICKMLKSNHTHCAWQFEKRPFSIFKLVRSQIRTRKGAGTGSSFKEGNVKQVTQRLKRRASAAVLKRSAFSCCHSVWLVWIQIEVQFKWISAFSKDRLKSMGIFAQILIGKKTSYNKSWGTGHVMTPVNINLGFFLLIVYVRLNIGECGREVFSAYELG